jgi:hypothetical protein
MINGIPVVVTNDTGAEERVVFASIRKCPSLSGLLVAEQRATVRYVAATRRYASAALALDNCEADGIDEAEAAMLEHVEALETATQALQDSRREFVVRGFSAAGYTADDADRLAGYVDILRIRELADAARTGAGRVDFSRAAEVPTA